MNHVYNLTFRQARWQVSDWFRVNKEKAAMKFAWTLPRWLVYWCAIRLFAHATTGKYSNTVVPDLSALDALKRWEDAK